MLTRLNIKNIVLIDELTLNLASGLTIFTGETGAGKSIMLDSLSLALGGRGDGKLVRKGADKGQVRAIFDIGSDFAVLDDEEFWEGLEDARDDIVDQGLLILSRTQLVDGRTRAHINNVPVSAKKLKNLGSALVEIHGQHADRALMDAHEHRRLLDQFGQHHAECAQCAKAHDALLKAQRAYETALHHFENAQADEEYVRHAAQELKDLGPQQGEENALADARAYMMGYEKYAAELDELVQQLDSPGAPAEILADILRRIARRSDASGHFFAQVEEALDRALTALGDADDHLAKLARNLQFDPKALEETEERLFALRAAARKYQCDVDDLPAKCQAFLDQLQMIDHGEETLAAEKAALDKHRQAYQKAAESLHAVRQKSKNILAKKVNAQLPDLKLGTAAFMVQLQADKAQISQHGFDQIAFWVQTNPGAMPGPILKVASGGELSRILLALRVALSAKQGAPVMVFDEIDTGVGGAVADSMGRKLSMLSEHAQILAITHAPQVAARAMHHILIQKSMGQDKFMRTQTMPLDERARQDEIGRMLAGETLTDEARAAAKKLLQDVKVSA